jgi:ribose 5-phosphate isomerase B
MMRVGVAADHEGYELKEQILGALDQTNFEITDYGANALNPGDDYPDFVIPLAKAVASNKMNRGIAICGSGIGACIASNKVRNVRAGLIHDVFSSRQGVEDDDMNIICMGARLVSFSFALELVQCFLQTKFSGEERFKRRLAKIAELDEMAIER